MNINVDIMNSYEISVDYNNLNDELDKLLNQDYFVCIDKKVYEYHYDYLENILKNACEYLIIDAVETNKDMSSINQIIDMLFNNEAQRTSYLIAIGGGIIGDVSGFAASIYMRGINLIQVPTTLLAQVDSSIGSKVAINAYNTKNLIGAFYAPTKVIIDLKFLDTITTRIFKEGLVEIIKHGLIYDKSIIDDLNKFHNIHQLIGDKKEIKQIILKSLEAKKYIVQQDPNDIETRHVLNYGHTFAHALESSPNNNLYHGECVAIGMLVNSYINENKKVYYIIKDILEKFECVKPMPEVDFKKIYHDKKRNNQTIKEVIIDDVNNCEIVDIEISKLINEFNKAYEFIKNDVQTKASTYVFKPSPLKGNVIIPSSKSMLHRYLIASALSQTKTTLKNVNSLCDDINVTIEALKAFKIKTTFDKDKQEIFVEPDNNIEKPDIINMQESATSLRLLMPILINVYPIITFIGESNLINRPLDTYLDIFKKQGIMIDKPEDAYLPISLSGNLMADNFIFEENISSQFISGLLFALPLCDGNSSITLKRTPESLSYIKMSLQTLKDFNILINHNDDFTYFAIAGNQLYASKQVYEIEQDYSSRAFFEVLKSFEAHDITIENKVIDSLQGDKVIIDVINNNIDVLDLKNIPDSAPIMAIYYAINGGSLINTYRLRYKESNRLQAITDFLDKMEVTYHLDQENSIHISPSIIKGNYFDTYKDHRITMSLIIASSIAQDNFYLNEVNSINKSFATFLNEYKKIGGYVDEE